MVVGVGSPTPSPERQGGHDGSVWRGQDENTSGTQHAMGLGEKGSPVVNVLDSFKGAHHVELTRRKGQRRGICRSEAGPGSARDFRSELKGQWVTVHAKHVCCTSLGEHRAAITRATSHVQNSRILHLTRGERVS